MDGENNGSKPYEQMGWFGGFSPYFWFNTHIKQIQLSDGGVWNFLGNTKQGNCVVTSTLPEI